MFGRPPPWGRDPLPDMHSLLSSRTRHRHTHTRLPSLSQARGVPTCTHHLPHQHSHEPQHAKHPSFNDIPTPSSTTSSDSECGFDTYTLDEEPNNDDDEHNVPHHHHHHHHHHHRFTTPRERTRPAPRQTPDVQRTSINLPRRTATSLRSDDLLLLPPLTHVRIRMFTRAPYPAWDEELRAAVPDTMRVGDVVGGVVAVYFGEGVRRGHVMGCVRVRGQWREVASSVTVGEVGGRGEGFGRGEVQVKIEVGDGGQRERERAGGRFGGRGPRGSGFGVERVLEREESRFRVGI